MQATKFLKKFLLASLAGVLIFAAYAKAAHDLSYATYVFGFLSFILFIYINPFTNRTVHCRIPFVIPIAAFLTATIASLYASYDAGMTYFEIWISVFTVIFFLLLINLVDDSKNLIFFWKVASLSLLPVSFSAVHQQFTGHPDAFGRWEIHGTLINANVMAGFACPWLFVGLSFIGTKHLDYWGKYIVVVALILLALSRSLLACLSIIVVLLCLHINEIKIFQQRHRAFFYAISVFLLITVSVFIIDKLRDQIPIYYYGMGRAVYWKAATAMFLESPWTGIGLGAYAFAYPIFRTQTLAQGTLFAHSSLLGWSAETGILGILALGITGYWIYKQERLRQRYFVAACASTLVFGLASIHQEYFLNKLLLAALLGSALFPLKSVIQFSWNIPRRWMAFGLTVCLIPFWLSPWFADQRIGMGKAKEEEGNWKSAMTFYQDAIEMNSFAAEAYAGRCRVKRTFLGASLADDDCQKAIQRRPIYKLKEN